MKERAAPLASLLLNFLSLLFMALLTFAPDPKPQPSKRKRKNNQKQPTSSSSSSSSSWDQIKNLITCKQIEGFKIHDPSKSAAAATAKAAKPSSCGSICSFRDVVHGNTRVVDRADNSPESSSVGKETRGVSRKAAAVNGSASSRSLSSSARSNGGGSSASKGMQLRKLSGCYECHTIVDPSRYPSPRTRVCACSDCGEVFPKIESLELHQAVRHAVSELGPEDSGRNIVEIIFKSSWLKKDSPICNIERILKVHNTQRTIQRFEDCRDAVKIRATTNTKKNPRCAADGNELLRFHCTTLACSLGAGGSSSLCSALPGCGVCTIIMNGFQGKVSSDGKGVCTTASSGRAHDCLGSNDDRRAMMVCRVVAGRVMRTAEKETPAVEEEEEGGGRAMSPGSYDSVAGYAGVYSNLEELYVFNPKAILPCFVVIYKAVES